MPSALFVTQWLVNQKANNQGLLLNTLKIIEIESVWFPLLVVLPPVIAPLLAVSPTFFSFLLFCFLCIYSIILWSFHLFFSLFLFHTLPYLLPCFIFSCVLTSHFLFLHLSLSPHYPWYCFFSALSQVCSALAYFSSPQVGSIGAAGANIAGCNRNPLIQADCVRVCGCVRALIDFFCTLLRAHTALQSVCGAAGRQIKQDHQHVQRISDELKTWTQDNILVCFSCF